MKKENRIQKNILKYVKVIRFISLKFSKITKKVALLLTYLENVILKYLFILGKRKFA